MHNVQHNEVPADRQVRPEITLAGTEEQLRLEISRLQGELNRERIRGYTKELENKQKKNVRLQSRIAKHAAEKDAIRTQTDRVREEQLRYRKLISAIEGSLSWRLTASVRKILFSLRSRPHSGNAEG